MGWQSSGAMRKVAGMLGPWSVTHGMWSVNYEIVQLWPYVRTPRRTITSASSLQTRDEAPEGDTSIPAYAGGPSNQGKATKASHKQKYYAIKNTQNCNKAATEHDSAVPPKRQPQRPTLPSVVVMTTTTKFLA